MNATSTLSVGMAFPNVSASYSDDIFTDGSTGLSSETASGISAKTPFGFRNRTINATEATYVENVNSLIGTTEAMNGVYQNITFPMQTDSASSNILIVSVAIAVVVVIAVVGVILYFCRRRSSKESVRVWQIPRAHQIPKERTTWHEEEEGAEVNGGFNPDLELQPTNIFQTQEIHIDHNTEFMEEYDKDLNSRERDRETVVFNPENKSFKLRHENEVRTNQENDTNGESPVSETMVSENRASSKDDSNVKVTTMKIDIIENTQSDYCFAKPIDVEAEKLTDQIGKEDVKDGAKSEEKYEINTGHELNNDGEYIAMTIEDDGVKIQKHSSEILVGWEETEEDNAYTNVDIRRVKSMQVTPSFQRPNDIEEDEQSPRRIGGKSKTLSSKPPIAQPRFSKSKIFDPYDYPPGIPIRSPLTRDAGAKNTSNGNGTSDGNQTFNGRVNDDNSKTQSLSSLTFHEEGSTESENDSEANVSDGAEIAEVSSDISDMGNLKEDDIYDYPRKLSQS